MSDKPDIVTRLRECDAPYFESSLRINSRLQRDIDEAADEIERLRAALMRIAEPGLNDATWPGKCESIARAALNKEKP